MLSDILADTNQTLKYHMWLLSSIHITQSESPTNLYSTAKAQRNLATSLYDTTMPATSHPTMPRDSLYTVQVIQYLDKDTVDTVVLPDRKSVV